MMESVMKSVGSWRQQWLLMGFLALLSSGIQAEDTLPYDRVSFVVSAEKAVENDELTATLFAEQSGQDTAAMAGVVNEAISWAMEQAKKQDAVESRTLAYTTSPVYRDGKVDGWQVRQSIELKSRDSEVLSGLLGVLQENLRIQGIEYSVSTDVRRGVEEELITEALAAFKRRAAQVQANMERGEYRVVNLSINTPNDGGGFQPRMMAMVADAGPRPVPAPTLDSGKQTLTVTVSAEIELSRD
ncbi:MAG TPA: SIMPL domain-containing protein [Thiolinea sp.]|nr:SIMPL domain-containing protein [Thiolinea sp.]